MTDTIYTSHTINNQPKPLTDKYFFQSKLILEVEDSYCTPVKEEHIKIGNREFLVQCVCFNPINFINEIILSKIN